MLVQFLRRYTVEVLSLRPSFPPGALRAVIIAIMIISVVIPTAFQVLAQGTITRPTVHLHLSAPQLHPGGWQTLSVEVREPSYGVVEARVSARIHYSHLDQSLNLPRTNAAGQSQIHFRVPLAAGSGPAQVAVTVRTLHFLLYARTAFAVVAIQTKRHATKPATVKPTPTRVALPHPTMAVWPAPSTVVAPKRASIRVVIMLGHKPVVHATVLAAADFREGIVGLRPALTDIHGQAILWLLTKSAHATEWVRVDVFAETGKATLHRRLQIHVLVHRKQPNRHIKPTAVVPSPRASSPTPIAPAAPIVPTAPSPPPSATVASPPSPTSTPWPLVQPTDTPTATAPPTVVPGPSITAPPTPTIPPTPTAVPPITATLPPTPTDTPTATPTPTAPPTATTIPTATPSIAPTGNLVINGGFENSPVGAVSYPWLNLNQGTIAAAVVTADQAHTGVHSAFLGGPEMFASGPGQSYVVLWQRLTIPATATSATLSFWYLPQAAACAAQVGDGQDAFVDITDANGNWTNAYQLVLHTLSNAGTWQHITADVSAEIGQSVNLAFEVVQNNGCWAGMYVDDVSLTLSNMGPPPATATPLPTSTPVATQPPASGADQYQQELLTLINNSRAQQGLPPYTFSPIQSQGTGSCIGSYGHSVHMAQDGYLSHDQFPADICIPYHTAGENVGYAPGPEDQAIQYLHNEMMSEGPGGGHYDNIMSPYYTTVGLGLYYVNGTLWLTEDFVG